MYRQQYPDAPNLFSNVRRPYRRTLAQELRRTWLTSLIGVVMVHAGLGAIFWNEGRAVQTSRSLDEGHRDLVVPETNDVVFEENNGKLLFVADRLRVQDPLLDDNYGISIHAVKLKKVVQMYQWYETEDRVDTSHGNLEGDHDGHVETSYSYDTGWFDYLIDSEAFNNVMGHHNPEDWPINSTVLINSRVKLGDFLLGKALKDKFDDFSVFTSDERPSNPDIKMHAGLYFHAADVWNPQVGDIRIQFAYAGKDGEQVTVIGKQAGREIRPYETESGDELLLLHKGLKSASDVFQHAHSQNRLQTYLIRVFGWFVCFLGFNCLSSLLELLGIGWVFYRPLLGILLFSLASIPYILALIARCFHEREFEMRHRLS